MNKLFMVLGVAAMLSSCTVYRDYQLTGQPIGTKTGKAKSKIFGNSDTSLKAAAESGGITKIGAVEVTVKVFIFPIMTTKVYGE